MSEKFRRPFSIVLPDGKHNVSYRTLFSALFDAQRCNISRAARELPLVTVLDRDTGKVYKVAPDADLMEIEKLSKLY